MADKRYIATLLLLLAEFTYGEDTSVQFGLTNGNITLKANIIGLLEAILWKWNGNKVFEIDKFSRNEYGQFKGRAHVNTTTGDLTVSGLTESDSGDYSAEAQVEGKLQYSQHHVEVIDAVADPVVSCELSGGAVTLICASDLSPLTQYSWEGPGGVGPGPQTGSELHLGSGVNRDAVYTCAVKNPVSERRSAFALHHCFSARGLVAGLAIALGVIAALLGVAVGMWFYCRTRAKAGQQARNEQKADTQNETPTENVPFLEKKAERHHEEKYLDEGSLRNQEDDSHSVLPLVSSPPQGSVCDEQGGVINEQGGGSIEKGGVINEQGVVSIEQGGGSVEKGGVINEQGGGSVEKGGVINEQGGASIEKGGVINEQGDVSIEQEGV